MQELEIPRTTLSTLVRRGLVEIAKRPRSSPFPAPKPVLLFASISTDARNNRAACGCAKPWPRANFPACFCTASPDRARPRSISLPCAESSKPAAPPSCWSPRSALHRRRRRPASDLRRRSRDPALRPLRPRTRRAMAPLQARRRPHGRWYALGDFRSRKRPRAIIVDEEHDSSYKQEETPRYHARDIAVLRAKMSNAVVVLGSATPSLESYFNAKKNKYALVEIPDRVESGRCLKSKLSTCDRSFRKPAMNKSSRANSPPKSKSVSTPRTSDGPAQPPRILSVVLCRTCGKKLECQQLRHRAHSSQARAQNGLPLLRLHRTGTERVSTAAANTFIFWGQDQRARRTYCTACFLRPASHVSIATPSAATRFRARFERHSMKANSIFSLALK